MKHIFKNQLGTSAFRLVIVRILILCFLILSIFLPYVKIMYYLERDFLVHERWSHERLLWYTTLEYTSLEIRSESYADSQYSADWTVQWSMIPMFAFPFVLMYFGLKKRYTFDVGVIAFALFLGSVTLPPLMSPRSMGTGWDLIESEALIGSYAATITLAIYSVARPYLQGTIRGLEADDIPPPEDVEQSEVVKRKFILILALLSFVLPFAVEYKIYHYPEDRTAGLSTVYYWFGDLVNFPLGFPFPLFFLPIVYLPLIMMWLGMKRTKLFNNGVILYTIYWFWHLLFFLEPFYVTMWREHITAPTLGIVFFPTILLIYISSVFFKSARA